LLFVLDASVATKWFVPEIWEQEARELFGRFQAGEVQLCAPEIVRSELANSLRHHMSEGNISRERALECWADFLTFPIPTTRHSDLLPAAVALAFQYNGGVLDGHYVALAVSRDCTLITADERLARAFAPLGRVVHIERFASRFPPPEAAG
jgi:predicted nucleic acid-binding protein